MAIVGVSLEGRSACEATGVHEVQVGGAGQQQSNKRAISGTDNHYVWIHICGDIDRNDTLCTVLDCAILIPYLFSGGAER